MEETTNTDTIEINIKLPEDLLLKGEGESEKENLHLTIRGGTLYAWAVERNMSPNTAYRITVSGIPGNLPVACCFTEWDATNSQPFFGDAVFRLFSVQRANGLVRILGSFQHNTALNGAIGIIVAV